MIYENHFSLNQRPFTIAPNPDFLYDCGQYQEALAALQYGMLHRGGFVLLTGEVGTGKTTLCKYLLNNIPTDTEVALILHPQLDRLEMLQLICREFAVPFNEKDKELNLIERLTEFLLSVYSQGGHSVLIIDEAQHLDTQVLELIRLLTNLETHQDKLLQIILLGQPELKVRLQQYNLRQLNQRFTARFHLKPLSFTQMKSYIAHRIKVAGSEKQIFTTAGLLMLHKLSGGIPRLANLIADRSLMGGYASGQDSIGPWIVRMAAKEVLPQSGLSFTIKLKTILPIMAVCILAVIVMGQGTALTNNIKSFNVFNTSAELSSELLNCQSGNDCWQGTLPAKLLQMRNDNVNGDTRFRPVAIYDSGRWGMLPLDGLPANLNTKRSVKVRIILDNVMTGGALKLGDYNSSVPWVRSVLDRWDGDRVLADQEGVSTWQLIEPSNTTNATFSQSNSVYDQGLEMRIKRFQQEHSLLVDGVVGSQTMAGLELLSDSMGGL